MFDIFAKLLSSITSFLFPLFASYKALKTSDPAQLTPWLMYWVVLACALLVESWTEWILCWIPFYAYIRLGFLLYLVLPQTQGARIIYQTHIHPYLSENEAQIEDLIATAHDRAKSAGLTYLKSAVAYLKALLGLPPSSPSALSAPAAPSQSGGGGGQSYTQSLLARFSVPSARWAGAGAGAAAASGADVYSFLASAVATAVSGSGAAQDPAAPPPSAESLIPRDLRGAERASFVAAQRARLSAVLGALDTEARALEREDTIRASPAGGSSTPRSADGGERPPSGLSSWSGLSKSRSEVDFEKIDAESGAEEETVRRRNVGSGGGGGSWMPFKWGSGAGDTTAPGSAEKENEGEGEGQSSGVDKG
ncbi:related to receptor expression-enhancing protein 4 [Cephalotrichum gorgonifer]|uniref:Protein YOP1 n=1 Tax=Cephalotrichum gorgonifer TaxID=2041049 RepID=A0AAE8N9C9_9PEZI|nr:related to receptor expression-enhancing protein 4 [Cephalotrichum gorgonifer]